MLPLSRNLTVGVDTPVPSGLLNDLQDAVISAKHGQLSLLIWGSAFHGKDVVYDESVGDGALVNTAAGIRHASAPIPLAAGTKIVSVQFFYNPAGHGVTITPAVMQKRLSTGADVFAWNGAGDNTGSAIESQTVAVNHTMLDTDAYIVDFLFADNTPGSPLGIGAKVIYERP